ncbi:MAG: hypothetical protein WC764_00350 [Candidatus Paceibacterota bacterium]|jgi:hypothetical protein
MKIKVLGYGPADLLEQILKQEWSPCNDGGQNFTSITVKSGELKACFSVPRGKEEFIHTALFLVRVGRKRGVSVRNAFVTLTFFDLLCKSGRRALLLNGNRLVERPSGKKPVRYCATFTFENT